jgi:signal transduction histidine kinase
MEGALRQGDQKSTGRMAELRRRFEEEEAEVLVGNCKRGAVIAIVATFGGSLMDWFVYPDLFLNFLFLRAAVACFIGAAMAFLWWNPMRRAGRLIGHLIVLFPILNVLWMIVEAGPEDAGAGSPYYAGLCLVMVGSVLLLRWKFTDGVTNSLLAWGGYVAVAIAIETPVVDITRNSFFISVTGLIACVGLFYYNRLRFSEYCLRAAVLEQRQELERNHERLQALDEAKTRFFANISHELRTPLTLILVPVEKMRAIPAVMRDPRLVDMVDSLEENGLRLLRLINDLLDLVRLDSDEMKVQPECFRPSVFIDGLGRNLRPMAERNEVELDWNANAEAEQEVYLDRGRLEKIVLNLSVNALKFTPPGGVVRLAAIVGDGALTLAVADTGQGMTQEQVRNAFERFWQADSSVRRKHQGVGIGLALVKSLTETMDGDVKIVSAPGEGTSFEVRIPLVEVPASPSAVLVPDAGAKQDVVEELNQRARLDGGRGERAPRPPVVNGQAPANPNAQRVLVADDEAGLRTFLRGELEDLGCEVYEAANGAEAWDLARSIQPHLAVLDMMMPEMDGITLSRKLRENEATAQIPIVLVTARADESPRIEALQAGVSDFLTKPFSTAELRVRIANLLDGQRYQRQLNIRNRELGQALEEIKENEARLLQAEKLSSLGRMSAGIVHEVNNPLNYTKTALHALRAYTEDLPDGEKADYRDILGDAEEGVGRVIAIVSDLRSFTRGDALTGHDVVLATVVESARRLVSFDLQGIRFDAEVPEDLVIRGNDNQLCQILVNFIQNSAQAVEAARGRGDDPTIRVAGSREPDGTILLKIRDNGCGIAKEDLENIFDPFFTKRDVGEGMGLGLSICHRILQAHGAEVGVESIENRFTEFTIRFSTQDLDEEDDDDPEGLELAAWSDHTTTMS